MSTLRLFLPLLGVLAPGLEHGFSARSLSPSRSAALWYHLWKDAAGRVSEHGMAESQGSVCRREGDT